MTRVSVLATSAAFLLLAPCTAAFAAEPAQREPYGGCGPSFHRGPYGGCRPNGGVVVVAPRVVERPVVVVPRGRVCPIGFSWRYGRCRPI
jgi:hypothetical protein